jgi:hypothetical protein
MATIRFRSWGIIKIRMPETRAKTGSILLKEKFSFMGVFLSLMIGEAGAFFPRP